MKKILLTLLTLFSIGTAHQVTASVEDLYKNERHASCLHFKINNQENLTRKVRIGYQFFAGSKQSKW